MITEDSPETQGRSVEPAAKVKARPLVLTRQCASNLKRVKQQKRGTGAIYDVIDEWLAPAFAKWIGNQAGTEVFQKKS